MSWKIDFTDSEKLKQALAAADQAPISETQLAFPKHLGTDSSSVAVKILPPANAAGIEQLFEKLKWHTHMQSIHGQNVFTHYTCPTAHGESCPICKKAWDERKQGNQMRFKQLLAKETFVVLAYVIEGVQEQEGQIRLFQFDWRVKADFDKLLSADINLINPDSPVALLINRDKINGYYKYSLSIVKVDPALMRNVNLFDLSMSAPSFKEALGFDLHPFEDFLVDELIKGRIDYADSLSKNLISKNEKQEEAIPPLQQEATKPSSRVNFEDFDEDDIPF